MRRGLIWIGAALIAAPLFAQEDLAARRQEPSGLERRAQEAITKELGRRARRAVRPEVLQAAAERATARMTRRQIRELVDRGEPGDVVDGMIAAARQARLQSAGQAALGSATSELLFVPVAPCRILDTRQVSAGAFAVSEKRDFLVAGSNGFLAQGGTGGGCGIPDGATEPLASAVVFNFIAVGATGPGHLTAWEFGEPEPLASVVNYAAIGLNIANGIIVNIKGTSTAAFDLSVRAAVSSTHLVADVTGYFTRFPIEAFAQPQKELISLGLQTSPVSLADGLCHRITTCTVTSPPGVPGTVVIKSWVQVGIDHTSGSGDAFHDRVIVGAKQLTNPVNCTPVEDQVANMDFEVPDIWPTDADWDGTISHGRTVPLIGNTTRTYELLGRMIIGASAGDRIESARMVCLFIPD